MALDYKLEFNNPSGAADDSTYIQLKSDPSGQYIDRIGKEDYMALPDSQKTDLATAIFGIDGVVEISIKAFRVWIMKTPVHNWEEVSQPALFAIRDHFGETEIAPLPGSGEIDGSGLRLDSDNNRRTI